VGKGAGLGLSACYGIIREHRGSISCTNRLEGGTTIRIEIPCTEELPVVKEPAATKSTATPSALTPHLEA